MARQNSIRRSRRLRMFLCACSLTAIACLSAQATVMRYLEVEDLTRLSSDVFQGQVVSTATYWNPEHTRIYTSIRVRVDESLKGSTRRSEVVTVTQYGGEKDGVRLDYSGRPEFSAGEPIVLFTVRGKNSDFIVVGLKQGKMRVEGNEVTRDFSGITLVDRSSDGAQPLPIPARSTRMKLDDLRNRVSRTR